MRTTGLTIFDTTGELMRLDPGTDMVLAPGVEGREQCLAALVEAIAILSGSNHSAEAPAIVVTAGDASRPARWARPRLSLVPAGPDA